MPSGFPGTANKLAFKGRLHWSDCEMWKHVITEMVAKLKYFWLGQKAFECGLHLVFNILVFRYNALFS